MQPRDIKINQYKKEYKEDVIKLFNDFQDYLISLDPLKRLRRMPNYGENVLSETIKETQEKDGIFYVVLYNEIIIGLCAGIVIKQTDEDLLSWYPTAMGRVTELYIDSNYRGNGFGTLLMNKLEKYFKQKHCKYVWVEVFTPNTRAHDLYKKLAYEDRNIDLIKKLN